MKESVPCLHQEVLYNKCITSDTEAKEELSWHKCVTGEIQLCEVIRTWMRLIMIQNILDWSVLQIEMGKYVECLPCKHEDLCFTPAPMSKVSYDGICL